MKRSGTRHAPHHKTRAKLDQHIKQRAHERVGMNITKRDIKDTITTIKAGKAELVQDSTNRPVYRVELRGKTALVVYDKRRKALVTVLPRTHHLHNWNPTPTLRDVMPDNLLQED